MVLVEVVEPLLELHNYLVAGHSLFTQLLVLGLGFLQEGLHVAELVEYLVELVAGHLIVRDGRLRLFRFLPDHD